MYGSESLCSFFKMKLVKTKNKIKFQFKKLMKKVRLSKTKSTKFNESGQLVAFYALSVAWAANVFREVSFVCFKVTLISWSF